MAVNNVTSSPLPKFLNGKSAKPLPEPLSPVQKLVQNTQAEAAKQVNYFKSEAYFKSKANQLKYMMALYQNFGLTEEYNAVANEAQRIVKEYVKLYGLPKEAKTTDTTA